MLATLVPDRLTPMTAIDVAKAFKSAFATVCGVDPSRECLALLVAQSALETGRWKSIHCFNFGNVKASSTYTGKYCQFRCNEVINGKVEWFDPPHPQTNFRAFDSAETGAIDHISFLANRPRYAKAWQAALTGMPLTFVETLRAAGYFTADAGPYARAVTSLWKEYCSMLDRMAADTEAPPPVEIDDSLHEDALRAVGSSDVVEWSRQARREAMKEP